MVHRELNDVFIWVQGDKEWLDSEQLGNSEPFPMTHLPVYFINIELPGVSEQFFDDLIKFFYYVNYGLSIITSKVRQIILVMKT